MSHYLSLYLPDWCTGAGTLLYLRLPEDGDERKGRGILRMQGRGQMHTNIWKETNMEDLGVDGSIKLIKTGNVL